MKRLSIYSIIISLVFFSCNSGNKPEKIITLELLPRSIGGEFEILIVGENITKRPDVKDIIDSCLYEIVPALPQIEFWFDLTYLDLKNFDAYLNKHLNIVLISVNDKKMNKFIGREFPDINTDENNKKRSTWFNIAKNKWSAPQIICNCMASNNEELFNSLMKNRNLILENFDANEKKRIKRLMYRTGEQKMLTNQLNKNHNITLKIPKDYILIKEIIPSATDSSFQKLKINGFAWYRGKIKKANLNIMLYYIDFNENLLVDSNFLKLQDEVWKEFVRGENKDSYIATEYRYAPEIKHIKLGSIDAIEVRGLWKMVGDWGGGPFINYLIHDKPNNRLIVVDAFIFAPGKNKKKFLKKLEIILHTFKI